MSSGIREASRLDGSILETEGTDSGNAIQFAKDHGRDVRFTASHGWMVWTGSHWEQDTLGRIVERAKLTAQIMIDRSKEIIRTSTEEQSKCADHCDEQGEAHAKDTARKAKRSMANGIRCRNQKGLTAMVNLAKSIRGIATDFGEFDRDPCLLNVENGTIDLRTGELRPHRREDLLTKCLDIPFNPNADAPNWSRFLNKVFSGDLELVRWVQRWVGWCLSGDTSEHLFAVLHGDGSNGKSTFTEAILHLLGPYGCPLDQSLLAMRSHDQHPTGLAGMAGKRFAVASEIAEGLRLNEPLLKSLTGGDTLSARLMHKDFFNFRPTAKLAITGNYKPRVSGCDHGLWRRMRLVPFAAQFWKPESGKPRPEDPDMVADPQLKGKLFAEMPGILAWAVRGAVDYFTDGGLGACQVIDRATKEYQSDEDTVSKFVEERCEISKFNDCESSELYKAYSRWIEDRGERPLSQTRFSPRVERLGYEKGRGNTGRSIFKGLKLNPFDS